MTFIFNNYYPPSSLVEFQLVVVDETVCESAASATVCVQLRTDTEREVTASVQPSDLSTQSESCLVVMQYTYYTLRSMLSLDCIITGCVIALTILSACTSNRCK